MIIKCCIRCNITNPLTKECYFIVKGKFSKICKKCIAEINHDLPFCNTCHTHKPATEFYSKGYSMKCKNCFKIYNKQYKQNHPRFSTKKNKSELQKRLERNLRCRLNMAIKQKVKLGSAIRDLGCSIEELKKYLESKFQLGMSWSNWGTHGWHIDHIIPLSKFDLEDVKQLKKAINYTNLQPLWAFDNHKKAAKLISL